MHYIMHPLHCRCPHVKKRDIKKQQKQSKNKSTKKTVFIEVQTGSYFGEDDIVRIEDDYNRV